MTPDPVKAKLIELVPEILSDRRGYKQDELDQAYREYIAICKEVSKEDSSRTWASAAIAYERVKKLTDSLLLFQDRSITLADVLRAMKRNVGKYVGVTFDGDFLTREYGADSWIMEMPAWNLTTDYDGQTQEVKDFVGKLIGVTT